ncbi:three component ABC system middle component [Bacillus wiedmannii]|uniref:three component ABC system middle component n=1 Tax=Bacillus wiedmannii TaxID=1890302 RepID=UPI000D02EAC9|nr:three component ABC system middle component [Bacillus wiedmannii]PRT29283.1 hypothetical protein C6358_25015 [Bacillus wiedmannii]PRT40537.1 hypothetical protein C6359_25040 [Bacillus wiedmannii]
MIASDTYASTNPALCSLIIWHFLKGFEEVNEHGCEFPILFLPIPIVLSKNIRKTFQGTNSSTSLLTWLSREPQILLNIARRIETASDITRKGIMFGGANYIVSFDIEGKVHSTNKGLVQKHLKEFLDMYGKDDLKEVFQISKRLGNWCGQLNSTRIILNIMGLTL